MRKRPSSGFTLIELAVVLVVIGLLAGAVLLGRELIVAGEISQTVSEMQKYQAATTHFADKYAALPGDLTADIAQTNGFAARGPYRGEGDGNGVLEANTLNSSNPPTGNLGVTQAMGEIGLFWVDLSQAGFIDHHFSAASATAQPASTIDGTQLDTYLPRAKLGRGNFFYVFSSNKVNYFGLGGVSSIANIQTIQLMTNSSLTTRQAYGIDRKIDDGLPLSGAVQAKLLTTAGNLAAIIGNAAYYIALKAGGFGANDGTAATAKPTTCYDNGGVAANAMKYTAGQGDGSNCAIIIQFQ